MLPAKPAEEEMLHPLVWSRMPVDVHEQERVSGNEKLDVECSKLLQGSQLQGRLCWRSALL